MDTPSPQPNAWDKTAGLLCALCCLGIAGLALWTLVEVHTSTGMVISTAVAALLFVVVSIGYFLRFALTVRAFQVLAILILAGALIARFQTGEKVMHFGVLPWVFLTIAIWQNGRLENRIKAAKRIES